MLEKVEQLYARYYRKMFIIPLTLFILFIFIAFFYPGIKPGIDIAGGTMFIVRTNKDVPESELFSALSKYELTELKIVPFSEGFQVQYKSSLLIESLENAIKENDEEKCQSSIQKLSSVIDLNISEKRNCLSRGQEILLYASDKITDSIERLLAKLASVSEDNIQSTKINPSLGELFWTHAMYAAIVSIILIFIVVFAFFREFIPSIAIIAAATFDILGALSGITLLGIPFSLPVISALLMLLGYSVDTDIMLTTRILKGTSSHAKDASLAFKTGLTMTLTSLLAVTIMFFLSSFWGIELMYVISSVLFFGLLADLVSTWLMNAPLLLWYVENKKK